MAKANMLVPMDVNYQEWDSTNSDDDLNGSNLDISLIN